MGQCFGRCCHPNRSRSRSLSKVHCQQDPVDDKHHDTGIPQAWTEDSNCNQFKMLSSLEKKDVASDHEENTADHRMVKLSSRFDERDSSTAQSCDDVDGVEISTRKELTYQAISDQMPQPVLDQDLNGQKLLTSNKEQNMRVKIAPPLGFDAFIRNIIVPKFEKQRRYMQKQFAVLLLISEEELMDIENLNFHPSDPSLTNNNHFSMPASEEDYHNYIVARPQNDNFHAEAVIFEKLDQLWNRYLSHNGGIPPKCFILYSWNFPCTKCTDLIIKSFSEEKYKAVSVIVAATAYWDKEEHGIRHQNESKMENEHISVSYYRGIYLPGEGTKKYNGYFDLDSSIDYDGDRECDDYYW